MHTMRKIIPIIFVAVTLIVGCKSATMSTKTGTSTASTASTEPAASTTDTNAVAATPPAPAGPNTPEQTASENLRLGEFAGVFIVLLTIMAVKRC